ncbi:MAG: epimerase [Bacteroidota bacterium]|jgi:dTDP-6-deoxy-L-talose 4-dehydrogenase (NAD+)|nr:epimerase [Bacteroidota bacterium]
MKILVTGATGGLGRLIIPELLKHGHRVIATSRSIDRAKSLTFFDQVEYFPYDICSKENIDLFTYFGKPDSVIHLAWDKLNDYYSSSHLSELLECHKEFIFNLIRNGLKDLNCAGTCYEYGLREGELNEAMVSDPVLPYSKAKNLLREYIDTLKPNYNFSMKWIRIFFVFGEIYGRENLYTHLLKAISKKEKVFNMSGGEQIRDFLTPEQVAEIFVSIATQIRVQDIINCCSGKPVKLRDFINNFLKEHKLEIDLNLGYYPYLKYEPMALWGSVVKLRQVLENNKNN